MALREEVVLDITAAQRQIDALEAQLGQVSTPITVPVDIQGEQALTTLEQQVRDASGRVDIDVDAGELGAAEETFRDLNQQIDQTQDELDQARIRADRLADEFDDLGRRGSGAFGSLRSALGPLAAGALAGFGISELVDQFNQAVTAASNLEQSIGGVQAIFGDSATEVLAFGENAAQSVGLATDSFNQLASQLGAQLQSYGFSVEDAATESQRLIELGADLAATFGGPVNDAVAAIGSLLRGEINPIERYGVAVNQAAIQANALEEGLIGTAGELDIQAKALSGLDLLFEQTAGAQGQFAREAETTAGQLERQRAEFANLRAEVGEELVPAFEELLGAAPDVVDAIGDITPAISGFAGAVVGVVTDVATLVGGVFDLAGALGDLGDELAEIEESPAMQRFVEQVQAAGNPLRQAAQEVEDIQTFLSAGISAGGLEAILGDIAARAEAGVEPVALLGLAFRNLQDEGADVAAVFEEVADAAGASDAETADFLSGIVSNADDLGLTVAQVRVLRDVLNELADVGVRGEGLNFDRGALGRQQRDVEEFVVSVTALDAAVQALDLEGEFDTSAIVEGINAIEGIPIVIDDLGELASAASGAGQGVSDFLDNLPDNVTLDLSAAETEILQLSEVLGALQTQLDEVRLESDVELPELTFDSEGTVTNLDEVVQAIIDQANEDAEYEANISDIIVGLEGDTDLSAFISALEPEVAAALAEAFALDEGAATEAQAALDGSMEGLAEGASTRLAEVLLTATPQQVAELGVFAAENFVSESIRRQIGGSAEALATEIETQLGEQTISPSLIIDLTNAQINTATLPNFNVGTTNDSPSTSTSGGGNVRVPDAANFVTTVNINNATSSDISTGATQAAQTIGAVSHLLPRVP